MRSRFSTVERLTRSLLIKHAESNILFLLFLSTLMFLVQFVIIRQSLLLLIGVECERVESSWCTILISACACVYVRACACVPVLMLCPPYQVIAPVHRPFSLVMSWQ